MKILKTENERIFSKFHKEMNINFLLSHKEITGWNNTGDLSKIWYNNKESLKIDLNTLSAFSKDCKIRTLSAYSNTLDKTYKGPYSFIDGNGCIY